ncbi:amidohydrolase [Clostridium sp. P21]|uniref:Amidohydrolase n=1 Tax=Clostridium muellerianum TaxID=2716538 RepID=A0A7Y0EJ50_9CLOT|nr:M20 aminoacylase family protein [Clostridium muellerianum]NMM64433.1 amidohydrolase [Clostridium muellerianum]
MNNEDFEKQLIEWRHYFHMHPETAFEEKNTSEYIAKALTDMGLEVHRNIGGTGIVANLTVGDGKEVIGIRTDIDAINLTEEGKHPYTSQNHGKMHGCGHDGHMTTVLGAAKLLTERKNFSGTVRFIFQPAEEPGKGSAAMIKDGLFEHFSMDEIYGMHNMPGMPAGSISTRSGGIMGSEDNFVIRIKGQGSHASSPHMGKDPIVIASEIVLALQTIISRNMNPSIPAVISCTEFITDGIHNAIPTNVVIKGDTRSYSPEVQKLLEERMKIISEGICQINGAECQFEYTHEFAPTVNSAKCVDIAVRAAQNVVGENNVNGNCEQWMASEDFGTFLQKIPGCLVFIGTSDESAGVGNVPLHNSCYDYNDNILKIGAEYFAELVKVRLPK